MIPCNPSIIVNRFVSCLALLVLLPALASGQESEADSAPTADDAKVTEQAADAADHEPADVKPPPAEAPVAEETDTEISSLILPDRVQIDEIDIENWAGRVDALIADIANVRKDEEDADQLFLELDHTLVTRLDLFSMSVSGARSPLDKVASSPDLPDEIKNITDLHLNIDLMYAERLRLLEYISPALHLEVTATDVYGVQQLGLEVRFIWHQIVYRALNVPVAAKTLWRRVQIAPIPVIWRFLEFIIAIGLFRWWRRWFPETLRRMRASLSEIRPRLPAVVRRIKLIWYVDQVRKPLEWLAIFHIFFALIDMPGVNYIVELLAIVVRWILLGWFSVALLNAVAARGDAGLAGENPKLRLRTFRLIATWLVLLGLGLDLADNLAGIAALHAWVLRTFQILALPLIFILLSWWRKSIFQRLEREQDAKESLASMLEHQSGLRSYTGAASGAVWLLANGLRRSITRSFLRVGSDKGITTGFGASQGESVEAADNGQFTPLPDSIRSRILRQAEFYERYARSERRGFISRAKMKRSGLIALTGERGIGKSKFLDQVHDAIPESMLLLNCISGRSEELEENLANMLNVRSGNTGKMAEIIHEAGILTIAIDNIHRLARPVIGGMSEITRWSEFIESIRADILWLYAVDSFAWQFIRRFRADRSSINDTIDLGAWTEDQLSEFLDQRNGEAEIDPDFEQVQVPHEFVETAHESAAARNKTGVFRMIWNLSGGNPSVALRIWADSLYQDESGNLIVRTPTQPAAHDLDDANLNVLLALRSIAQSEVISEEDVADNLRLPRGAASNAIHYAELRGWIETTDGGYRLSWKWFRTITRVLSRQNLLAR